MTRTDFLRALLALMAAYGLAIAVFLVWPGLDLAISAAFFTRGQGFVLAKDAVLEAPRNLSWDLSIGAMLLAATGTILGLAGVGPARAHLRRFAFVFLLFLFGPVLLADTLLKHVWGRVRPANIVDFGASGTFTPFWSPSGQCVSNCSFVSGEAAGAAALAVTFLVFAPFARRWLGRAGFVAYAAAGIALPIMAISNRIITGRHFLSDTVFAVLVTLTVALALARVLLPAGRAG
ncbi:MAG: phosphatase PAP2 family protein [Rhodobacteraceae bacterium]|nr:phosphatase PAP2 family protein [Paracoccaceae bacterium]